jgi:hypothetical protein
MEDKPLSEKEVIAIHDAIMSLHKDTRTLSNDDKAVIEQYDSWRKAELSRLIDRARQMASGGEPLHAGNTMEELMVTKKLERELEKRGISWGRIEESRNGDTNGFPYLFGSFVERLPAQQLMEGITPGIEHSQTQR